MSFDGVTCSEMREWLWKPSDGASEYDFFFFNKLKSMVWYWKDLGKDIYN